MCTTAIAVGPAPVSTPTQSLANVLAGWSKICPGCNIGRKYPDSFIGKKVRNHWGKGCSSHDAYVEVYGSEESSPKKDNEKPDKN